LYIGVGEKRKKVRKKGGKIKNCSSEKIERFTKRALKKFYREIGEKNKGAVNSLVWEEIMGLHHTKKLPLALAQ